MKSRKNLAHADRCFRKDHFDPEHKVSGDAFLNCQMGKQRFHLGQ